MASSAKELNELAVKKFKEYLKIPSVHPKPVLGDCVKFLEKYAEVLKLKCKVHHFVANKPIVIMTWQGNMPELPSLLLNSHMDVVPVYRESWTHGPFDAEEDQEGNIYGRGAQDMKCVSIQYLEAIRRLQLKAIVPDRTVHLTFMPDEEIGGLHGMGTFYKSKIFEELNVGFALDEGATNPDESFPVYYGERCSWKLQVDCFGQTGHGSVLIDNTPGEKLSFLLRKFFEFRATEKAKLDASPSLTLGDVTSVNLTMIQGGIQSNVIPEKFSFVVDMRIAVTVKLGDFENKLKSWFLEAGDGVSVQYEEKQDAVPVTALGDTNELWAAFRKVANELDMDLKPQIFPAATDSRYLRTLGLPVLGFSPMNNTELRIHGHDEFLNRKVFLKGITIYEYILKNVIVRSS